MLCATRLGITLGCLLGRCVLGSTGLALHLLDLQVLLAMWLSWLPLLLTQWVLALIAGPESFGWPYSLLSGFFLDFPALACFGGMGAGPTKMDDRGSRTEHQLLAARTFVLHHKNEAPPLWAPVRGLALGHYVPT